MSKWILVALVFFTTAHADVIPVPDAVVPTRIEGVHPRNVVFILSDDHRYDAMSFMGHPFAKTPHMDAMVKEGAHLENAFVTTSLCSPSRASILTGLYTFRHRVIDNQRPVPEPEPCREDSDEHGTKIGKHADPGMGPESKIASNQGQVGCPQTGEGEID